MKLPEQFVDHPEKYRRRLACNLEGARALVADAASDALAAQATTDALPGNQWAAVAARVFRGFEASARRFLAAAAVTAAQAETAKHLADMRELDDYGRGADSQVQLYGPPGIYRRCSFENFKAKTKGQERALAAARWFLRGSPDGAVPKAQTLVLAGTPGSGKSHLAAAAYLAAVDLCDYVGFCWIAAPRLLRQLQEAKGDRLEALLAHYGDADPSGMCDDEALFGVYFLVIDDLGAGTANAAALERMAEVIDRRTLQGLPTIVTTNADRAELSEYLGARCLSRLLWRGIWCPLVGEDQRQLPAPAWFDAPPPELPQIAERRVVITAEVAEARKRAALLRAEARASLERVVAITDSDTGITAAQVSHSEDKPGITAAQVSERTVAAARKHKAEVVRILAGYGAKRGSDLKPEQWAPYLEELDALEGKAGAVSPLEQLERLEAAS